jgi:plastocyanin
MTKLLALILACLALGLVACGGDDDDGGGGSGGSGGGSTEQSAGGGGVEVSMENVQFEPEDVTVKAGETITFKNNEALAHDVQKTSGPGDDFSSGGSGEMQQGDTFELTLDQPGTYEYVCDVHAPGMTGTITVK